MAEENQLIATAGDLPIVRSEKRLEEAVRALLPAYDELRDGIMEGRKAQIESGLAKVRGMDLPSVAAAVTAGRAPASIDEIRARVAHLVAVTKHLDKVETREFQDTLVQDIADELPSQIALIAGLRHVRQTSEFLPSIAAVLSAIRDAESNFRSAATRLERLPERISEAEAFLLRST